MNNMEKKKFNYLLSIDGDLKVVASGEPIPLVPPDSIKDELSERVKNQPKLFKEWLIAADKFDIADKENEDLFKITAFTGKDCSSFEIVEKQLKQGILIPSENVAIKRYEAEFDYLKAYFIPPTLIEEGEETQGELWREANKLYMVSKTGKEGRKWQSEHFTIDRKTK